MKLDKVKERVRTQVEDSNWKKPDSIPLIQKATSDEKKNKDNRENKKKRLRETYKFNFAGYYSREGTLK